MVLRVAGAGAAGASSGNATESSICCTEQRGLSGSGEEPLSGGESWSGAWAGAGLALLLLRDGAVAAGGGVARLPLAFLERPVQHTQCHTTQKSNIFGVLEYDFQLQHDLSCVLVTNALVLNSAQEQIMFVYGLFFFDWDP